MKSLLVLIIAALLASPACGSEENTVEPDLREALRRAEGLVEELQDELEKSQNSCCKFEKPDTWKSHRDKYGNWSRLTAGRDKETYPEDDINTVHIQVSHKDQGGQRWLSGLALSKADMRSMRDWINKWLEKRGR